MGVYRRDGASNAKTAPGALVVICTERLIDAAERSADIMGLGDVGRPRFRESGGTGLWPGNIAK